MLERVAAILLSVAILIMMLFALKGMGIIKDVQVGLSATGTNSAPAGLTHQGWSADCAGRPRGVWFEWHGQRAVCYD